MDAFVAAYTVPALVRQVLGERALEAGFLPWFMRARKDKDKAARLAREVAIWLLVFGVGVSAIILFAAPALIRLIGLGFDKDTFLTATRLARILVPFVVIVAFAAFLGTILQARGRFLLYGVAPGFFSLGVIGCAIVFSESLGIYSLAIGVLVGGMLFAAVQVPGCIGSLKSRGSERARITEPSKEVRGVGRLVGPVIAGAGVEKLGTLTDRMIASLLSPGSISSLYYAFRLIQLPYSVLALAVGRVVGPKLAGEAEGPRESFRNTLIDGMRLAAFLLFPVSAVSIVLSDPIVSIVYARGAFGSGEVGMTSKALMFYSIGLVAMGFVGILTRAFASILDTKTPVKVGAVALIVNVTLSYGLSRTSLTHGGVALATSVAFWLQAAVLWKLLMVKIELGAAASRPFTMVVLKVLGASTAAAVLLRALAYRLQLIGPDGGTLELLWRFVVLTMGYGFVYLVLSWLMGIAESRSIAGSAWALIRGRTRESP
jgi:putative peptidoglycan lipid II flippase